MKPMLPSLVSKMPLSPNWYYEIKYDGFRALLEWSDSDIHLWSRNGKDLLGQFPEIKLFIEKYEERIRPYTPLVLDGELVLLENDWKGQFGELQRRGRLKSREKIKEAAKVRPCHLMVFDLLVINGEKIDHLPFLNRKEKLKDLFSELRFPLFPAKSEPKLLQYLPPFHNYSQIERIMKKYNCEGLVGKIDKGLWESGKRSTNWLKFKNWKTVSCFITAYDDQNGFFHISIFQDNKLYSLGSFTNGIDRETKNTLRKAIIQNSIDKEGSLYYISPAICLDLHYLEWDGGNQLREPYFHTLRLDLVPQDCTYIKFQVENAALPAEIPITHPEKILWTERQITKIDFLTYLRKVAYYQLPFLKDRVLTVIRAPHGEFGETFYQKNVPETAPSFIKTSIYDSSEMIVCNEIETLIWLGNQLAIEFHIPFRTITSPYVYEIVLDLDPPSRDEFHLAVRAATIIKNILDEFSLTGFVKFSGNKGLQVYIPLPENTYTWEQSRVFTEFIATFLTTYDPDSFTVERLKRNRHGRLYVDFLQHAEGKTMIAPYSVRLQSKGLIAAPLFWEEINKGINPETLTIPVVLERLLTLGDPFTSFFSCRKEQPFQKVLNMIKKQ